MTEVTDSGFRFDSSNIPFPHRNTPHPGGSLADPDGTVAFDFHEGVYPPKHQASIESPDLTDPTAYDLIPRTHEQMMEQLKSRGLVDAEEPSHRGPVLDPPLDLSILDISTPLEDATSDAPKRRGRPRSTQVETAAVAAEPSVEDVIPPAVSDAE